MEETMSERPSYSWENKQTLLKAIMGQLEITDSDLENEPSWIKSKLREANIDKILAD